MKRSISLFVFFLLLMFASRDLRAQKYGFSIDGGHQFGIFGNDANDVPFTAFNTYSMGSGLSNQLMFHVFPDSSNWYFSTGINYLSGNRTTTAKKGTYNSLDYHIASRTIHALRWVSKFTYVFNIRNTQLNLSAGFILPVISGTKEDIYENDSNGSYTSNSKIKYYTSVGFNGGIGVSRQVVPGIRVFFNTDIILLNTKVKSRAITGYSDNKNRNLEEVYPNTADKETQYWKEVNDVRNKSILPATFNKGLPTDKLSYSQSNSGIALKVGLLFLF